MKNKILVVLLMTLVVLVSGCTMPFGGEEKQTTTAGTQGLAILSFGPDVERPTSGETMNIEAKVKNVGVSEATNISGELYLLSWGSVETPSCSNLEPPKPDIGREGGECTLKWSVTPPSTIKRPETYDVGVHISYGYKTKTTATVYALSKTEYRRRMEAREPIPTVKDIRNSNAPIHVDVRMQNVLEIGGSNVPVTLIFTNVGNGNTKFDSPYFVIDSVTVKMNNNEVGSCSNVHLLKGGREGSCNIEITPPNSRKEIKLPIEIETSYTYVASVPTKIVVYPKPFE